MGRPDEMRPVMRAADIRRAVTEWTSLGFHCRVDARNGLVDVSPPQAAATDHDSYDDIDFGKK